MASRHARVYSLAYTGNCQPLARAQLSAGRRVFLHQYGLQSGRDSGEPRVRQTVPGIYAGADLCSAGHDIDAMARRLPADRAQSRSRVLAQRQYIPAGYAVRGNGGLLTTVGDPLRWNRNFTDAKVGGRAFVDSEHQKGRLRDGRTIRLCRRIDGPALEGTERGQPQRQHGGISGVAGTLSGAGPFGHRALQRLVGQRDRARASSR